MGEKSDALLPVREAIKQFPFKRSELYKRRSQGEITFTKVGRLSCVYQSEIDRWHRTFKASVPLSEAQKLEDFQKTIEDRFLAQGGSRVRWAGQH
jgi:hypothetical protein